jgi:hypothetical protein
LLICDVRFLNQSGAHFVGWQYTKKMDGRPLRRCEIFCIVTRFHKGRHAVVNESHAFIRLAREDGEVCSHWSVLGFFQSFQRPAMPKGSRPVSVNSYLGFFWPFGISFHSKIASPGIMTRPLRKASFQNFRGLDAFGSRIEEKTVGQLESPPHEFELAFAVLIDGDDRLYGTGRNIVIRAEVEFVQTGSYLEGVGDALLVGFAAVAATHDLSVRRQREKLAENKVIGSNEIADSAQEAGQMPVDSNQHG